MQAPSIKSILPYPPVFGLADRPISVSGFPFEY